ncbi:hypothetical protein BpHYR1_045181 [Brachionus plicatilis]|uniref:Uncharacterized protein n=1 Tax=Brachionus plicatilis TaxID=10195 RepID=A0A3M7SCJ5_BRAPC|nr:hypothetical protein BpHYR1_045181 [Brachionus plicatilis]
MALILMCKKLIYFENIKNFLKHKCNLLLNSFFFIIFVIIQKRKSHEAPVVDEKNDADLPRNEEEPKNK